MQTYADDGAARAAGEKFMNAASKKKKDTAPEQAPRVRTPIERTVWLADLTYTQQTVAADVMPNAVGGIATFTETRLALPEPIRLFKYPEKLIEALERDGCPGIIGFSNYIWNGRLSVEFARAIKKASPDTVVVFGGPNYPVDPAEQERQLREHPEVDFTIIKEGELAFAVLVEALQEDGYDVEKTKRRELASVHSMGADGTPHLTTNIDRIRDLAEIPSPYATGRMDEFFDGMLLPIVQTNRGCPFSCTFCVEGVKYYNKVYRNGAEKVRSELDYIGRKMAKLRKTGGRNDLFIANSNFGMYREDIDTCQELARTRKRFGWPEYINVATGKNQKERVLAVSKMVDGAIRLSGSVQSLDPDVLDNIKRSNISADGLMELALAADEIGANSYSEIILGLPGDSRKAHFRTVRTVMDAGFTNLYLFQLMLLPGTDMDTPETKRQFGMVTRYRVLPRCYGEYTLFGERLAAAEIEEICVASKDLSFEDYLECRQMHLVVTIFHNDGVFLTLLKLLRMLNLSVFRWIELLQQAELPPRLKELFAAFERETREELWDSRDELAAFTREPGIVKKFIDGDLGNNLLFVHKTLAITQHVRELAELANDTIRECLKEAGRDSEENLAFVDEALRYHMVRMSNLFENRDEEPAVTFEYDVRAFEEDQRPGPVASYRLPAPKTYRFALDDVQSELIERYISIYGATPVGLGRILSKVYVRKLFRHPVETDAVLEAASEYQMHIAGLQN